MITHILKLSFISLLLLFCFKAFSQGEQLFYFQQKEGTEKELRKYLSNILEKNNAIIDTLAEIYVNFIPPMKCPRCEGVISAYNKSLQKININAFIINILIYEKEKALSQYIHLQNFQGNILFIDTSNSIQQIFHINNKEVTIPYITKFDYQKGRLITAIPSLGIDLKAELIEKIIHTQTFDSLYIENNKVADILQQPLSFSIHTDNWEKLFQLNLIRFPKDSIPITESDTLAKINNFVISPDGKKLLAEDFLSNSFLLFSKQDDHWKISTKLSPTLIEDQMFISKNIPPEIHQYLKENHILVSMYLNADFSDSTLYIMASLPKLNIEIQDSNASLGYYNTPVCLIKNSHGENIKIYSFDTISLNQNYGFSHSTACFFEKDSLFVFKVHKGWPVRGTTSKPQDDAENPFLDAFYTYDNNTLLLFNVTTSTLTLVAPLDPLYKKFKLGYYVNSTSIKKCNDQYYWADKKIGKIHALSKTFNTSTQLCDLFKIDTLIQQQAYNESLDYLESYIPYFKKEVIDFDISENNHCIAIVSDGMYYYLYQTHNDIVDICSIFPQKISDLSITKLQFGYDEQQNKVIYGLYQNNENIVVYQFDL